MTHTSKRKHYKLMERNPLLKSIVAASVYTGVYLERRDPKASDTVEDCIAEALILHPC